MKISKAQLVQIIKEEAANFKKELSLKNELAQIQRQLNEVKAGGFDGKKYKPNFEKVTSSAGVSDTIKEEGDMDEMEELMAAIKTIAKACGLSGTIELEDEMGDEEGEEEIETDVIEPGDEEGEGEEGEEGEDEEGEDEEGEYEEESEEEGEGAEESAEESAENEEALEEENENAEESKTLSEGIERKRMMQLAGLK